MPALSPALAFQKVVQAALTAVLPTVPHGGNPPHSQKLPYIYFGPIDIMDHEGGHSLVLYISFMSKAEGTHEVHAHSHLLRNQLHNTSASQDGWKLTCIRESDMDVIHATADGVWQGVMRLQCLASPE